jgi:Flp pilus assembly pilin Flp
VLESLTLVKDILKTDQRGVTAVEYALVAGALVLGVGAAFLVLTNSLSSFMSALAL